MILYPHVVQRMACLTPGACFVVLGFIAFTEEGLLWAVSAMALVGVILMVRAWRMGVVCEDTRIVVRGQFWSTAIPLPAVTRIDQNRSLAAIRWRSTRRNRWTLITAFTSSSPLSFIHAVNKGRMNELRRWVRLHR